MAFIAFVQLALYFGSLFGIGYLIFSPFQSVVSSAPSKGVRFHLADLLSVFLPFQMGFALINLIFPDINWNVFVSTAVSCVLLLSTFTTSFYGMRLLWRMDIREIPKRVALLGFVMPCGFVVTTLAIPILISSESVTSCILRSISLICLIAVVRRMVIWIVPNGKKEEAEIMDNIA